jgi:hypothetical protein
MSTVDPQRPGSLDMGEQIARIDNLLIETQKLMIDSQKIQREYHLAPWQVFATLLAGGAAFFAAGAAIVKLLIG